MGREYIWQKGLPKNAQYFETPTEMEKRLIEENSKLQERIGTAIKYIEEDMVHYFQDKTAYRAVKGDLLAYLKEKNKC